MASSTSTAEPAASRASLWGPVALWCALIFAFSSIPDLHSGLEYDYLWRKLAHMAEYAVLWVLSRRAAAGTWTGRSRAWGAGAFLFCLAYAVTDEFHQTFVFGREGSARDVLIDAAGAFAAWRGR